MRYTNKRQTEKNNSAHHAATVVTKTEEQERQEFIARCKKAMHVRVWTDERTSSLWRLDQIKTKPAAFARAAGISFDKKTGFVYPELLSYVRRNKAYLK